jgi:hypothetical protein
MTFALATMGYGQGTQTGTISGTVVDTEGSPLPGCTITLTGEKLLGERSFVTTETGRFRFPSLSPGSGYTVKVVISGFNTTTRPGLVVNVGRTVDIEIEMQLQTMEEEVTVTAESPVVDVATSKISVNYSADFIASIPMNRDLYDIQNSIPGAIADGADYRRTSSILGGTVRSTLYALDGVPMNDPATHYSMANINVDVYEEIEFGIGALPAEVGQTDSAYINIVTKSGGNRFSGSATAYYAGSGLTQELITSEEQDALDMNPPESFTSNQDLSLSLGGPIIKDRLWFFANGRRLVWEQLNPLAPENRMANLGFSSPHYDKEHEEWLGFGKLTFQITPNLRYMGMLHYNHIYEPVYTNRIASSYSYDVTGVWNHENTYTTTHQVNWVLNQDTFFDFRGNYIHRYFPINSRPGTEGSYTYYDRAEQVYWGTTWYNDEYVRKKIIGSAQGTHFKDDFLGASHEFKVGVEFEQTEYHRDWFRLNPYYSYFRDYDANNLYYYSTSGQRGRLRVRMCPRTKGEWDVQDHTRRFSTFVQDSITAGRLVINAGLRFDYSYQYEPEQSRPNMTPDMGPENMNPAIAPAEFWNALIDDWHATQEGPSPLEPLNTPYKKPVSFTTLSPRIGFVYDLFGDGKTAVKAHFARYYEPVWSAKYNAAQIFGANSINYYWYDDNGNELMDLPGVDRYKPSSIPNQDPEFSYYIDDLKPPHMYEIIAGVEHELMQDFRLGLQFVYKINKNIVEDIDLNNGYDETATDENGLIWLPYNFTDPGFDGEFGTEDDNAGMTVYGLRDDRPIPTWGGINPPEAKRTYWAGILTFDKRMSNNWMLKGSILYSAFKGNTSAAYGATEGGSSMFDSPTRMINSYGRLGFDRPFQFRLMGSWILPYEIILSGYFQHRSGSAWTPTLNRVYFPSSLDVQESYVWVNTEELGSRRNKPFTTIDLRLEKAISITGYSRLNLFVDIFNLAGRSGYNLYENPDGRLWYYRDPPEFTYDTLYGTVSSVYGVRSIRLGARFSF